MPIPEIYRDHTYGLRVKIKYNGESPDITSDTVRLMLKSARSDADSAAVLNTTADVTTSGSTGTAIFTVATSTTDDLTAGKRYYEILWERSGGAVYQLEQGTVFVCTPLKDVST